MIRESIITALKNQGVSQRRCALDCGIAPQTFNNFLKGHRPLPLDKLERVMDYLKIEMK
jgi:lambda repressor-like predicted transcriptional regulator